MLRTQKVCKGSNAKEEKIELIRGIFADINAILPNHMQKYTSFWRRMVKLRRRKLGQLGLSEKEIEDFEKEELLKVYNQDIEGGRFD